MRRSYLLASSAQGQHEVKHRPALDVVLLGGPVVVHLLPSEDQPESASGEGSETDHLSTRKRKRSARHAPLLDRGDPLLLLHALLDALDGVAGLDIDLDLFARQRFHFDHLREETA